MIMERSQNATLASYQDAMLTVCEAYYSNAPAGVVFREPYMPYIPDNWNGWLVLAEAQNLADPNDEYVNQLTTKSSVERMWRLYESDKYVGVQPWDDNSIKLMLKAMDPEIQLNEVAVSNAVPWSYRKGVRANVNPAEEGERMAARFWKEILTILANELKHIVVFGNVAERVILQTETVNPDLKLRLPSPNAFQRIANMFDEDDLLGRYREVEIAVDNLGLRNKAKRGQIIFACHAVSLWRRYIKG